MRVLHVNKFLYRRGGAEAYMEDAADLLHGAGHEVAFFGMQHPLNTHLEFADNFPAHLDFEPPPAGLFDKARSVGRMFWSTAALTGITKTVDEFRPDIVHLHNIYHQLSPSILRPLRQRNIATVMTLHDYKLACPTYRFLDKGKPCEACLGGHFSQAVRRRCKDGSLVQSTLMATELAAHTRLGLYDPVTLFICPSRFMQSKMTEAGVLPQRLRLLHNFVDIPSAVPAAAPGPVVYAGRLSDEKGVDILIRSAALFPPGLEVVIAGDGPSRAELERLAIEVAPGRVRFTGRLNKSDVESLLASASVAAIPSRWYENQPLAILEAFSAGVPVAGTDMGGIRELVIDGQTGALSPPDDPAAFARAVLTVLDSPRRGRDMGERGRHLVGSDYSPSKHLAGLEEIYEQARAEVSRRAPA
jgi:glycosyltransferase involved in cell wall biosynthesis